MDRTDLDAIQSKLKLAIKNHQTLVVKMKAEPQNSTMKTKLHELQTEIMSLSDKQKTIVQNLRKELVQKQQLVVSAPPPQPQTISAQIQVQVQAQPQHLVAATSVTAATAPTLTALSVGQQHLVACSSPLQNQTVLLPTSFSVTVPTAHTKLQTCQAVMMPVSSGIVQASDLTMCLDPTKQQSTTPTTIINNNNVVTATPNNQVPIKPALKPLAPRGTSPPIRVPQYPVVSSTANKQTAQGQKGHLVGHKNHMPPPNSALHRRMSENDAYKDSRRSHDKRHMKPEVKQKIDFMASLDLVTPDTLKELQCKRTERKRRSTANPQFSYNFEPERKRVSHYMLNPLPPGVKRPRGRPPKHPANNGSRPNTPDSPNNVFSKNHMLRNGFDEAEMHDDYCAVCGKDHELLMCSTCNMVYHLDCLNPPLTLVPSGAWSCPKCKAGGGKNWIGSSETLALVHSYIATKAAKEEERRKLKKKSDDLSNEKLQLESKTKELNNSFNVQVEKNQNLLKTTSSTQLTIEKLKNFIKVVKSS